MQWSEQKVSSVNVRWVSAKVGLESDETVFEEALVKKAEDVGFFQRNKLKFVCRNRES